jgi:hypothetical protein
MDARQGNLPLDSPIELTTDYRYELCFKGARSFCGHPLRLIPPLSHQTGSSMKSSLAGEEGALRGWCWKRMQNEGGRIEDCAVQ